MSKRQRAAPDPFREPAVGDLVRAIHDGLVEGGLSTSAIRKLACALLAIASQGAHRESRLPPDPCEGWTALRSPIPQRDGGRRVPGDSGPFNPHVAP